MVFYKEKKKNLTKTAFVQALRQIDKLKQKASCDAD